MRVPAAPSRDATRRLAMTGGGEARAILRRAPLRLVSRAEQTMRMPAITKRWTAEEVRALIDESRPSPRYEVVDGELLVTPSPRPLHQMAVAELHDALRRYARAQGIGRVYLSPADLELEPDSIVQPDVFVVPASVGPLAESWAPVKALLVAVEVLSPSSVRHDRVVKRRLFQRVGVPEYWIVHVDARMVERWRPGDEHPAVLDERLEWAPAGASEPWVLDLVALFAEVHGERA